MTNPYDAINKADDLAQLLDCLGWTQVIQPEFRRARESLGNQLMTAVLDGRASVGGQSLTKEQIAGMMWGIDWLDKLFGKILKDGANAFESLNGSSE